MLPRAIGLIYQELGGGNVNIRTKLYPSKTIYKIKFGSGYPVTFTPGSNAFQNFQKNIKGNSDFIGYDQ